MAGKSRQIQDNLIVEALARGEGQTATATFAGVSVSTVRRRLEDSGFRSRIERYRETMLDGAAGKLGSIIEKAITTLESLLDDESPPGVRLSAARSVIEFTFKSREVLSWEKRLAELESCMKTNQECGNGT